MTTIDINIYISISYNVFILKNVVPIYSKDYWGLQDVILLLLFVLIFSNSKYSTSL